MSQDDQPTAFTFEGFEPANTTPVPDVLFDELLTELSGPELKVLLYIIRRTLGFKKSSDGISLSQFTDGITTRDGKILDKGCGIKKRSAVSKILKDLISKGCIKSEKTKTNDGDSAVTVYSVRFKGVVPKTALPSDQIDTTVVPKKPLRGSAQIAPTGSAVLVTHNKQLTTNSNIQETEEQEENAHVSDDNAPTPSLSESNSPSSLQFANEGGLHIQQGRQVGKNGVTSVTAQEIMDAQQRTAPSSLQETSIEESTPAPSDEQSSKQESGSSDSQSKDVPPAQDTGKTSSGKTGKAPSQGKSGKGSKTIELTPEQTERRRTWQGRINENRGGALRKTGLCINESQCLAELVCEFDDEQIEFLFTYATTKHWKFKANPHEVGGKDLLDMSRPVVKLMKEPAQQEQKGNLRDQRTQAGIKAGTHVGSSMPQQKPEPTQAELDEIERKMIEMGIKPAARKGA